LKPFIILASFCQNGSLQCRVVYQNYCDLGARALLAKRRAISNENYRPLYDWETYHLRKHCAIYACALNYCNRESPSGAPHRRLESQICVAKAPAVHSDPWPATEWSRACPALAGSTSRSGSKYQRGIDGVHSACGARRSALRRRGARALGFPRWHRARRSHSQAPLPPPTMLEWNKRKG